MFCPYPTILSDVPPINPLPEIAFPATSIVFAIILSAFNVPVVIRPPAIDVIPPLVSLPTLLSATNILPADIMVPALTDPVLPATSVTISPCELRCVIKALSEVCPVPPCDSGSVPEVFVPNTAVFNAAKLPASLTLQTMLSRV